MDIAFERKMIEENKVVAIIRGISSKDILKTVDALYKGGIRCCEVTFDHSSKAEVVTGFIVIMIIQQGLS